MDFAFLIGSLSSDISGYVPRWAFRERDRDFGQKILIYILSPIFLFELKNEFVLEISNSSVWVVSVSNRMVTNHYLAPKMKYIQLNRNELIKRIHIKFSATRERLFEMFIKAQNRWSLICGNGIWPPAVFDLCNEMLVSNNSVRIVIGRGGQTIGGIQVRFYKLYLQSYS